MFQQLPKVNQQVWGQRGPHILAISLSIEILIENQLRTERMPQQKLPYGTNRHQYLDIIIYYTKLYR